MHPRWLSNAYVVADEPGGSCVFVDSGAPLEPLLQAIEAWNVRPLYVLRTHGHADHVEHEEELCKRFGIDVATGDVTAGGLNVQAVRTPGHSDDGVAFVVDEEAVFPGDILFRDAVGGDRNAELIRHSVMDVLLALPDDTQVFPGHTDATTIGREREENPFTRYWSGAAPPLDEPVCFGGQPATLLVWSPDYDGNGKALVRFEDGSEGIVGGSRVERGISS
jgi:hydroxyacylglutathione hydrolase